MPRFESSLTPRPRLKLSRLRDIGWSLWDPIGLLKAGQKWHDADCLPFANEYDSYLVYAAGQLRRGASAETVARYLTDIEVDHMGLGSPREASDRALNVAAALQADGELWSSWD